MVAWLALLGFVPATIFSLLALLRAWRNARAIEEVHVTVNSRLSELLERSAAASRAEGRIEGRDIERSEEAERDRLAGS